MFHPCYISLVIAMASTVEFREAVAYALSCVHQEDLILKPKQEEALIHLYDGRDVFAWFPTGYGKSICYQLLPFMFDVKLKRTSSPKTERSVVLVISPYFYDCKFTVYFTVKCANNLTHAH